MVFSGNAGEFVVETEEEENVAAKDSGINGIDENPSDVQMEKNSVNRAFRFLTEH